MRFKVSDLLRTVDTEGATGDLGSRCSVETRQRWGLCQYKSIRFRVVELRQLSLVQTITFLNTARVALGEVILVILHLVAVDGPHLILVVLQDLEPVELLLDHFRSVLEKQLLIGDVQLLLLCLTLDSLHLAELFKEGVGRLSYRILLCAFLLRDLVDGLEVAQSAKHISKYPQLVIPLPCVLVLSLLLLLLVDDQLPQGNEVQLGTGELRMMLAWTILAWIHLKLIEHGLVLVPEEAEMMIVHL